MKIPVALTIVILAAGGFFGQREGRTLTLLRTRHHELQREAAALGITAGDGQTAISTRASKRPRTEAGAKGREFARHFIAMAKEMKEMEKNGGKSGKELEKLRMEIIDQLLSLDSQELKTLIAEIRGSGDLDDDTRRGMLMFSIMMLAEQNPQAALAVFTESSDLLGDDFMGKHALTSALSEWASQQPLEALKWIKENATKHPDLANDDAKRSVIAGAARNDFNLALQLIGELKLPADDTNVIDKIAGQATTPERRTEFLNALRSHVASMENPDQAANILKSGMRSVFNVVARSGYDASMQWIGSADLSAKETADLASGLNYYQTKEDTGKWLDWLSAQDMDADTSSAITRNLMGSWTQRDYQAAGEWLAAASAGPAKQTATMSYLQTIAPYEPEVAAQWAETLPAEKQADALKSVYAALKEKDKAAAEDFAARHGVDVEE